MDIEKHSKDFDLAEDSSQQGDGSTATAVPPETPRTSDDRNVLRSKMCAFMILGLAAVGLGFMTFFLTRGDELNDFEDQVSLFSS